MIDKEPWKIGTDYDKIETLIMPVQYHKKCLLEKKSFSSNIKQSSVFFLWMVAFKTHLDLTGKFTWIGKMTYNIIK